LPLPPSPAEVLLADLPPEVPVMPDVLERPAFDDLPDPSPHSAEFMEVVVPGPAEALPVQEVSRRPALLEWTAEPTDPERSEAGSVEAVDGLSSDGEVRPAIAASSTGELDILGLDVVSGAGGLSVTQPVTVARLSGQVASVPGDTKFEEVFLAEGPDAAAVPELVVDGALEMALDRPVLVQGQAAHAVAFTPVEVDVLDFGVADQAEPERPAARVQPTGTVGTTSPEDTASRPADPREAFLEQMDF